VYIGGGTPSLLCPDQIGALIDALANKFGLQPGAEITLEMDPATFDAAQLASVLAHGVNRISLGGQSFDDAVLEQLGRRHRQSDLHAAIDWLVQAWRDGALRSWSLDLIQNLPGQTLAGWDAQLDQAIASQAPHLSIYDLSVEPGTVFDRQRTLGLLQLPEDDLAVALMERTTQRLSAAGLSRYEISNHARPGHASRHNRVYWSGAGWWGFGMGATSAPWGVRLARPRTRAAYAEWLDHPPEESVAEAGLPLDDQLLVGLRRREGVTLQGLDADALEHRWQPFVERGWLQQRAGRWCLTDPEGMALSNQVLIEVILWWEECCSGSAGPNPSTRR
jgi:oxygen-independent coproporphyrinogen-3 oxidase